MIKVIKNGTVITMNKDKEIKKADIVIENNYIKEIVDNYSGQYDELIDATDKIVMPGLINTHTHLGMSIFRNTSDGLDLNDWLNKKIWPIEDKMTDNDIYYSNLLSLIEMIKTGTTTCADFYFSYEAGIKSILDTKFRCLYSRTIMDNDNNLNGRVNDFIAMMDKYNNKYDTITFSVAPHGIYTCSDTALKKCKELSLKYNIPIHIHFCETENEVKEIKEKYNMDPIDVLEKYNYLDSKLILAHGIFINKEKINKLNKNNISISHNIISNLNLGCGFLDIPFLLNHNINVCLGTDGSGSSNTLDMFKTMNMTSLMTKGLYKNPKIIDSYKVLEMATINGAIALGLEKEIGSLEINKKADIIVLDINNIEIYPINNLINEIVNNISSSNIITSIINGEVVMKDRKLLLNINEEDLKNKINIIIERLGL